MGVLVRKFIHRLSRGDFLKTIYLTYYFSYLKLIDIRNKTNFCNSQMPGDFESGYREGSTGNFPVHPAVIKKLISSVKVPLSKKIIDVGHGSGLPLYTLYKKGYKNLYGVEHGQIPFNISEYNLKNIAELHQGDAFNVDYSQYDVVIFCSPFRGELAKRFIRELPDNIETIVTVASDSDLEMSLVDKGYMEQDSYAHLIHHDFHGKAWKKE